MKIVTAKTKEELLTKAEGLNPTGKPNWSFTVDSKGKIRAKLWIICNPS